MSSKRFQDKVVIVTGSSNGIGRATAILFASEGAKVTIHGRSEKALQEALEEVITASSKNDVISVRGDIRDKSIQQKLVDETIAKFGRIDILVNNAGGLLEGQAVSGFDQPDECFDYAIDLNTKSVLTLTKLAMPHLIEAKGEVVMVSSISALNFAMESAPYYAASKAALDQITRSMATRYIRDGVRVNSVNPGAVRTTIMEKQGMPKEQEVEMYKQALSDPHIVPAGVIGTPEQIAQSIAFLADRRVSAYIIGHTLVVDGGSSINMPLFTGYKAENH